MYHRHARIFLERGPHRIGSVYKKAVFRQYTDASYSRLVPQPEWLGFLGPILRAEVDEVISVHLKNFATRNYTMHPHGVFYEKNAEGKVSDNEQETLPELPLSENQDTPWTSWQFIAGPTQRHMRRPTMHDPSHSQVQFRVTS